MTTPPHDEEELLARARLLCGYTAGDLAGQLRRCLPDDPVHGKGAVGDLLERWLGTTAGNPDEPDFAELGVELKTVSLDHAGRVRESPYICAIDLRAEVRTEWEQSRVRRKLARVLWFPVEAAPGASPASRHLGRAVLWSPGADEERALRRDWIELVGRIALGDIDRITAHMGQVLQIRPKARDSRARTGVYGDDGQLLDVMPRGFYLRAKFVEHILWNITN